MARSLTIERVTISNVEYLVLHKGDIFPELKGIDTLTEAQVKALYQSYNRLTQVIREFITLDSGYSIAVSGHVNGHIWLLEANRETSGKHHWLTKKVTKAINKMIAYLNQKIQIWRKDAEV